MPPYKIIIGLIIFFITTSASAFDGQKRKILNSELAATHQGRGGPLLHCNGNEQPGEYCHIRGQFVVFIANRNEGGRPVKLYARACDQGMEWDGASCDGPRQLLPWNDGSHLAYRFDSPVPNREVYRFDESPSLSEIGSGQSHTELLAHADSSFESGLQEYKAATSCRSLGKGWYLPSMQELKLIAKHQNRGAFVNSFARTAEMGRYGMKYAPYWSSNEVGQEAKGNSPAKLLAATFDFHHDEEAIHLKRDKFFVRCVVIAEKLPTN